MKSSPLRPRACVGPLSSSSALARVSCRWLLAATVLMAAATSAQAQSRFWITTAGGAFGSTANWSATSGGTGGATVPVAANTANFTIGGTYTVNFAGNVTNDALNVLNGNVTFDLNGNTYLISNATGTLIGGVASQTGRLTIQDGTFAVDTASDRLVLGGASSIGFLTVSTGGRLGDGTIDPNLVVGNEGTATFNVEENGIADLGFLTIGHSTAVATGTVNVSGANAVLFTSDVVNVGQTGTGTLNVQNAGTMTSTAVTTLGNFLGSNGFVKVTGVGSKWTQGASMTIGNAGDASLSVEAAGTLSTQGTVIIGDAASGIGTGIVTGTDSTWNMNSTLQLGINGLGNLAVVSGGRATTSGETLMSVNVNSESNAVVTGAGSRWSTANITVGNRGAANFTVSAGGLVTTQGDATIGSTASSLGKAVVSGAGSAWNVSGALTVANLGTGSLTVDTGGSVTAGGALTIGDPAGAQVGTVNLNGGTITANGFLRAGASQFNWTDGTLLLTGGTFNNNGAGLTINGSDLDDLPALRLGGGAVSSAASVPNITVGANRQGAMIVSGGSNFQTTTASFGTVDGGNGSLHVEGEGSTFATSGDLGLGGSSAAAGGLGTMTIGTGGLVSTGGALRLWGGGTINLVGGTLRFNTLSPNGGKVVFSGGTVQVQSNFNADAASLDALLGPGHTVAFGRKIETPSNNMTLQTNLNVSGGSIAGGTLSLVAGAVARFDTSGTATFTAAISNPAGARIYVTDANVSAGTTLTNGGELHLAGSTATVNAAAVTNNGLIDGSGRVNSVVTNNSAGQIRVAAGERLEVLAAAGTNVNNGLVDVNGGAIEFSRSVTNSSVNPSTGLIAARDATLRFHGGLTNNGALTFSAGVSDVFGDVTNPTAVGSPGRIIVTGGAQANFFDDVANGGSIQVSAAGSLQSTAVFLGSLSGGGVGGGGHVFIEGDARPGFSPGTMAFGGDVSFGPLSSLDIELAGTTPGTQYDHVTVAESAAIGGELNVSLLDNFKPVIGNSFQILTAGDGINGTFADVDLPELAGGAVWDLSYGSGAVNLSVGGILGDFNHDSRVDAADYTVWRDNRGTNSLAPDASGNGSVDQSDYDFWKANFGKVAPVIEGGAGAHQTSAVPEPSTCMLLIMAVGGMLSRRVACSRRAAA
jgi:T5SS/PEP-CTERM-associated repeat protein